MRRALSAGEGDAPRSGLAAAHDTRFLAVEHGARHDAARMFASAFDDVPAVIVADDRTYKAAGRDVLEGFRAGRRTVRETFLFGPNVHAEHSFVEMLQEALGSTRAAPVAVGSGTINDLTKLARTASADPTWRSPPRPRWTVIPPTARRSLIAGPSKRSTAPPPGPSWPTST